MRYIPNGAAKVASKVSSAVAYLYARAGASYALGYYGKSDKTAFNYRFGNEQRRSAYVAEWLQKMDAVQASNEKRQAEKKSALSKPQEFLKVGDVLQASWGYDQTNVDYYEVVQLFGKRGVLIREIGAESVGTDYLQGRSVPMKGAYKGEPMRKVVDQNGAVKVRNWGVWARKLEQVKVAGVAVGYKSSSWTAYA